ncbi:S-layer homology domain-containing protein [Paenibacillus alginolyticus]|uniref:S-layer homology domain-containing protein n=1 Tax=Paenibacillus alginolyticus TaxID=59839 RepID=UPI00041AA35A|nr:S-layer homology domain-containing protein [Paenibacillus alginolyticus]MCY9665123.1 S-layer homology domain-containing protein [Paenibacillus alginolyticus]
MSKSSSNIVRFNLKNKTKDIQGGEKKVMKKSLSVILSTAMALSMFSSVAFGKTSADFTDLKDLDAATKAKFDALISAGIFDGTSETTFGLKEEMNRAQFAKVAALITGVEVKKDLKTSSFSDVKADDAANGYALPYIEALKTAGITDGYGEGTYNPAGKVTKEQLATFLVRVLGKDADAKAKTGTDTTVSGWAQGYVALALELKLLPAGADGKFGGQGNATRDLLLTGAYEAKAQYVSPGKVSVTEAKATGVKSVTVTFSKPVDDTKATLALTRGTVAVKTTAVFAADKKSAVLTLTDVKVTEGNYTVTLAGLDAATVDKTAGTFTAENEKVTKISFVNAGDKVAKSESGKEITIKVKPENQYGEVATVSGTDYTANVAGSTVTPKRNADTGLLEIGVDTSSNTLYPTEIGVLPITVSLNQSSVYAQKTFKIGYNQVVSKVELGTPTYATGKTAISKEGDKVEFSITRYDQYGDVITTDIPATVPQPVLTPNDLSILTKTFNFTDKKLAITVATGKKVEKSVETTVTYYEGGASATAKISLKASAVPAKLEFGSFGGTLAAGEVKDQYIPINAYDADGKQLTADEIVDSASLITFSVTGAVVASDSTVTANGIVRYGENKGKLKITSVNAGEKGIVYFFASIYNSNIQTQAQLTLTAQATRVPETIVLTGDDSTKKALVGATTTFKVLVKDQYGETLDTTTKTDYSVVVTVSGSTYTDVTIAGWNLDASVPAVPQPLADGDQPTITNTQFANINDDTITFKGKAVGGSGKVKVTLKKGTAELKTFERSVEVIANSDLTYSANTISDLYGTASVSTSDSVTFNTYNSSFAKKAGVTVKDKSGDTVAVPVKKFLSVFSSDPSVAQAGIAGTDAKVVGKKAGKATITAVIEKANGESQSFTYDVNVKADALAVATLTAKANVKYTGAASLIVKDLIETKVVDNYGIEFANYDNTQAYNTFYGVQYVISDVKGTGSVTINNTTGLLTIPGTVDEFVIKAISANGKVATTVVTKN